MPCHAAFSFIDPFGWTGFPMQLVKRILKVPKSEIFLNFMYEEVNRFIAKDNQVDNFDTLFGPCSWQDIDLRGRPAVRNRLLRDLYQRQVV